MRIAVLGANGRVAHAVARAFLGHGHQVIAITRSGRCRDLVGKVDYRAADAMVEGELIAATRGADIIFNGLNPLYHQWPIYALPMARNVMAAARAHGARHLFIGNVYNYGYRMPVGADEKTAFSPDTEHARIRIAMETLFAEEAERSGVQTVILRAGDFYGTVAKGAWFDQAMITRIRKGVLLWPGEMDIAHAFAYLPDLAETFARLGERMAELPAFETFNFEGHTLSGHAFHALTEKAVGRPLTFKRMSWLPMRLAAPFMPVVKALLTMTYLWRQPHSLDDAKLRRFLGAIPRTEPVDAIRQALIDQGVTVAADAKTARVSEPSPVLQGMR
ncbi:NAD-dependent epimerase/dehydratase family protein [Rhizobium sp. FKL33]|uniref:NAD-dependent epimerase/dehydratase family protein n=1 Tax=Rhizobium sp. FKL33 TaxID=2562307 RepID=UPI001485C2A7|nr:NAD-dependent epimerase/dehydratase family protein [Rhizobium sp. FKL33]